MANCALKFINNLYGQNDYGKITGISAGVFGLGLVCRWRQWSAGWSTTLAKPKLFQQLQMNQHKLLYRHSRS